MKKGLTISMVFAVVAALGFTGGLMAQSNPSSNFTLECESYEVSGGVGVNCGGFVPLSASMPAPAPTVAPTLTPAGPVVIYREDFDQGAGTWTAEFGSGYCCNLPEPERYALGWADGVVHSWSRYPHYWWTDGNHTETSPWWTTDPNIYSTKWLNLVFRNIEKKPDFDLTDATITVRIKGSNIGGGGPLPSGVGPGQQGRLVFWFESQDLSKPSETHMNYAAVGTPLDSSIVAGWNTVTIKPELDDWICLGSNKFRTQDYGCGPIEAALHNANSGWGIIIFDIDPNSGTTTTGIPKGDLWMDWIEVSK